MKRLPVEPLTDDERAQLQLVLKHTTPSQRTSWLEDMRLAFGRERLKEDQRIKLRMQDMENGLIPPPANDR